MPGNILNVDTMFPSFRDDETSEQKLDKVTNYLYMLLEQLRYSLNNLDADNFNDTGLREISDGIARPLRTSFENELSKTNAVIEGQSNEFGSQIRALTAWVGTDADGNLISSAANITATANQNKSDVALLAKRVAEDESALAEYKISVGNTYASASSLTTFQNSVNKSLTAINQTASDQGALIELVAYYRTDEDGNEVPVLNSASIVAGVSEDEDFINLIASKVNVSGFVTFESLENDGDGAATVNGNNISLLLDALEDDGITELESSSSLNFIYKYEPEEMEEILGRIYTHVDDITTDTSSRYTLNIDANQFINNGQKDAYASLKLFAAGRISLKGNQGIYMGTDWTNGYITLDAWDNSRIIANKRYSNLTTDAGDSAYSFNTNGIYYGSKKIVDNSAAAGTAVAVFG